MNRELKLHWNKFLEFNDRTSQFHGLHWKKSFFTARKSAILSLSLTDCKIQTATILVKTIVAFLNAIVSSVIRWLQNWVFHLFSSICRFILASKNSRSYLRCFSGETSNLSFWDLCVDNVVNCPYRPHAPFRLKKKPETDTIWSNGAFCLCIKIFYSTFLFKN